jgi:hypothetical protein
MPRDSSGQPDRGEGDRQDGPRLTPRNDGSGLSDCDNGDCVCHDE